MRIDRAKLKDVVTEVAALNFGTHTFGRHDLINAVEARLRREDAWEASDDRPTKPRSRKTRGYAAIDFAISDLGREDRLKNPEHDSWRIPVRLWPTLIAGGQIRDSSMHNGVFPGAAAVKERLRRLARVTARSGGRPIPDSALRRESLYDDE